MSLPRQQPTLLRRPEPPAAQPRPWPRHDARTLTGPDGAALILLDGQTYQLRITRQGKLILTK
jgi:hemin uptake protein HemP